MEYKGSIVYQIALALSDDKIRAIFDPDTGALCLVKDNMNGAPVWRTPNKKDLQIHKEWLKRRAKNEI